MNAVSVGSPRSNGAYIRTGLVAGLVAAAVELVPVLSIQGALGVNAMRVLQAIASGLTGAAAYSGGLPSAALGLVLHIVISLVAGLAFSAAAAVRPQLLRHPVLATIGYGVIVYVVMSYVVVPLSAAAFPPAANVALIAMSLSVHIVAFALPIVLVTRRMLK
jgi:hypothetical protein